MDVFQKQSCSLPIPERIAVERKYRGFRYSAVKKAIFEETGKDIPETTIVGWFGLKGKLVGFYRLYAEQSSQLRKKEAILDIGLLANNAVAVLNQSMLEKTELKFVCSFCNKSSGVKLDIPTRAKLNAAIQVLNKILGKPKRDFELKDKDVL